MINKVTLIGRLGNDPEVKRLDGGSVVARFSLATSDSYKDKDGNWQDQTEWHNIVAWAQLAERAEKYAKKGVQVYVEGKIKYRKYTDQNNVERYVTDIVADTLRILEKTGDATATAPTQTSAQPQTSTPAQAAPPKQSSGFGGGDDLPF